MRFARMLAVLAFLACIIVTLRSFANNQPLTLTGIVGDSMCGAKHMMTDDAKWARACIKNSSQYALVVKDKVYTLDGKPEELDKLAGQTAIIVGTLDRNAFHVASVRAVNRSQSGNAPPSAPADPPAEMVTIEGLVRDIACPIQNKEATARRFNLKCAQDCTKLGSPLIILTDDGILYTPISQSMPDKDQRQRLLPFPGKYVRVRGQVFERAGTRAIAIKEIVELKTSSRTLNNISLRVPHCINQFPDSLDAPVESLAEQDIHLALKEVTCV